MNIERLVAILSAASALPFALAFSPPAADARAAGTLLEYRNYDDPRFYDVDGERMAAARPRVKPATPTKNKTAAGRKRTLLDLYDVDSDRTSLRTLLDPPAPPRTIPQKNSTVLHTPQDRQASLRAASRNAAPKQRASPIVSLYSIEDYNTHVLHSSNDGSDLCVVRFKAPWCQTCRTTNVAWERMASKLTKLAASTQKGIKFFSVELDGKDGPIALKDALGIEGVPQGIIHNPTTGISERKVKLTRSNLSALRKNLERYCTYTRGEGGLQHGMLLDGLGE